MTNDSRDPADAPDNHLEQRVRDILLTLRQEDISDIVTEIENAQTETSGTSDDNPIASDQSTPGVGSITT